MNLKEIKKTLTYITSMFFAGASVIWAEQINTKPVPPYVVLKFGSVQRTAFPAVNEDLDRYYPCSTTVEINLYTKGKPIDIEENVTGNNINTAVSDMLDFFNFIESDNITNLLAAKGIDISLIPPVRDLTSLQNDSRYRYRAMAEATILFTMEANGPYGTGSMSYVPNSSQGGTETMAEAAYDVIENVNITEGGND